MDKRVTLEGSFGKGGIEQKIPHFLVFLLGALYLRG